MTSTPINRIPLSCSYSSPIFYSRTNWIRLRFAIAAKLYSRHIITHRSSVNFFSFQAQSIPVPLLISLSLSHSEMPLKQTTTKNSQHNHRRRRRRWQGFYAFGKCAKFWKNAVWQKSGGAWALAPSEHTWYDDANYIRTIHIHTHETNRREKRIDSSVVDIFFQLLTLFVCDSLFVLFWSIVVNHDLLNLNFKWSNALSLSLFLLSFTSIGRRSR